MAKGRPCVITLTTDFGTQDGNVGVMKGVILGLNPKASIVDLSHDVPPQDIADAVRYFASEEASFVTGQTLCVNGGLTPW